MKAFLNLTFATLVTYTAALDLTQTLVTIDTAWESLDYIEFLPAGVQRPKYVFDSPSTDAEKKILGGLKKPTVTQSGV